MHALHNSKQSPRSRDEVAVDGLVVSGLTELALGALTGRPMAIGVRKRGGAGLRDRRGSALPVTADVALLAEVRHGRMTEERCPRSDRGRDTGRRNDDRTRP